MRLACWLRSAECMETIYFFHPHIYAVGGFSSRIRSLHGQFYLVFARSVFLIQSTSTKLLCLNVPHTQNTFRTTKTSILTKAFRYNPQDCFSLHSTDFSAFQSSREPNLPFFKTTAWIYDLLIATGKTPELLAFSPPQLSRQWAGSSSSLSFSKIQPQLSA